MAEIKPFRALHYNPQLVPSFEAVTAPPYDVIDDPLRAELAAKSPFNVVEIDLPRTDSSDPYVRAKQTLNDWRQQGVLVQDDDPALWVLTQDYTTPEGENLTRHGFFCTVRVEDYGPGRIRPHERIHPGPKEDRLRLTRATHANLSPIFSLFADPERRAWERLEPATANLPYATATDLDGTLHKLWRVSDPEVIASVCATVSDSELLIADGHHRYETARVYADEIGGEGGHRYVLMFLCWLSDSGLSVFATHRLLSGLDADLRASLRSAIERNFTIEEVALEDLQPAEDAPGICFGYLDSYHRKPQRLTLKDQSIADDALPDKPAAYRRLDTALLEALLLRGALGLTEDDIAELKHLGYSKTVAEARSAVEDGRYDAAFFLRPTPVEQVQEVARAGESMPPKSTFFFPKIPTGFVFNLLNESTQ
jgi:uncharacterized protein (DUF1015 family)